MSQKSKICSDLTQLVSILADRRHRRLLAYLHEKDGDAASIVELTDYLIVHEADSVDEINTDEMAISLHHKDLPKLADVGLVEYDARSQTVRYRGDETVEELFNVVANTGRE